MSSLMSWWFVNHSYFINSDVHFNNRGHMFRNILSDVNDVNLFGFRLKTILLATHKNVAVNFCPRPSPRCLVTSLETVS